MLRTLCYYAACFAAGWCGAVAGVLTPRWLAAVGLFGAACMLAMWAAARGGRRADS